MPKKEILHILAKHLMEYLSKLNRELNLLLLVGIENIVIRTKK